MSNKVQKWYMNRNSYDDVVASSGIELARNLAEYDFRDKLGNEDAARLVEQVRSLTRELGGHECAEYYSCNVNRLSESERAALAGFSAISRELADKKQATGLIISEDESVSVMINEDDHIRINVRYAGSSIREAFKTADRIDDYIDSELQYAYSDRYGYLTTNMSDVGTGMHASYVLSLPALTMSGKLAAIRDEVGKLGTVIRDLYTDNGKNVGCLYRVSNQRTLGCTEQEIIDNLDQVVSQIVVLERKRRISWVEDDHDDIEDKVFRSYGVLKFTKVITFADAMTLLAQLKLGCDTGLISLSGNGADLYRLMMEIQPAAIRKLSGCGADAVEINRARAARINERLPELKHTAGESM